MKILRLQVEGHPNLKDALSIDFVAQQRVDADDTQQLCNVFSNIYTNQVISFIGINASGKTTILKAISFALSLLRNEPLNGIPSREVLDGLAEGEKALFTTYFYHDKSVYKLRTEICKRADSAVENEQLIITDETLWSKHINRVKTKKSIYDFKESDLDIKRDQNEQFLPDDMSIMIAFNKKLGTKVSLCDMARLTDYNMLDVLGYYPKEILAFLDSSIEYLSFEKDGKEIEIRLKFMGKDEILLNHPIELNKYLSSGTIKGISVFMRAVFVFCESGYLVVDELENHFNKEIAATLIRLFMDRKVNKNGAVLIFSTHYSELLDQFDRNDSIYIVKNRDGICATNLSELLKRNDMKKSEVYDSDYLDGTVPTYESYIAMKKALMTMEED